ncbi:hypothetical protein RFF58_09640 [Streptococcus ruminantium]|nr:hypothetical protein [Streptococcus ruminantium]
MRKREKNDELYVVRLYLFDIIPLWKVRKTRRELEEEAILSSSWRKMIEYIFIDDEEEEDGREI